MRWRGSITGDGLYGLFRSLGLILILLHLVMMTMMSAWYIKEAKKDFRLLVILGNQTADSLHAVSAGILGGRVDRRSVWSGSRGGSSFCNADGAAKRDPGAGAVFPEVVTEKLFSHRN